VSFETVPVSLGGWALQFYNQWPAVFRPTKHAWTDFSLIRIEIEHERYLENWNISLALLGFTLYVTWSYHKPTSESESV
jgi:hypothetical protein